MRFPVEPLGRFVVDVDPSAARHNAGEPSWIGRLADALGTPRGMIHRWIHDGMSTTTADRCAIYLGLHPACVWPEWVDSATDEPRCKWCGQFTVGASYCSPIHGELSRSERQRIARNMTRWWVRVDRYRDSIVMEEAA